MTPSPPARSGLRIGFVPGVTLTKWRTIWRERFPRVPLDVIEVPEADQRRVLDAGEMDLCFVRLPIDSDRLHVIPLYDEVPVAWVAKDHPFTALDSVSGADLADQEVFEAVEPHTIDLVRLTGAVLIVPMSLKRALMLLNTECLLWGFVACGAPREPLVGCLLGDAERLRDARPGPALPQGRANRPPLQPIRQTAQRDHRREGIFRIVGFGQRVQVDHSSTIVDDQPSVNRC